MKTERTKSKTAPQISGKQGETKAAKAAVSQKTSPATGIRKHSKIVMSPVVELRPHPLIAETYGAQHEEWFLESINTEGILTPLLITPEKVVVSGSERLWAANELGMEEVPCCLLSSSDPLEIEQKVLISNAARRKTNEQRIREYQAYKRIEEVKAEARKGARNDLVKDFTPGEAGKSRDLAAAKVGWSGPTAERGSYVLSAIEKRSETDNMQDVEELRATLNNKSVNAAFDVAQKLGWIDTQPAPKKKQNAERHGIQTFRKAKAAATKLAETVKSGAEQFTPVQVRELRQKLVPVLKWIDGLDPVSPVTMKEAA